MSVNYSAKYGRGFIVDWTEIEQMSDENQDDFFSSKYTHWICGCSDNSPIFFGIVAIDIDCEETGYHELSPKDDEFSSKLVTDMIQEFKEYFPDRKSYCPHNYIMGCVG